MTTDLQALGDPSRALRQRFDDLTTPHREALWRFCRKLTGNPWDAEDLVQDVLLKAFGRLSFAWQPVEPRAYLFRIASNAWIDHWRRERATTELDEATHHAQVEPELDALDTRDALKQVVDHLPPRQRVVFLLTEAFGFTHVDAGCATESFPHRRAGRSGRGHARARALRGRVQPPRCRRARGPLPL